MWRRNNLLLLVSLLFLSVTAINAQIRRPTLLVPIVTAVSGGGPYTFVKTNAAQASASSATITVQLTTVTAGHLIVLGVKHEGAVTTITASDGTTSFTGLTAVDHANGDVHSKLLYLLSSVASGTVTYTVTFASARTWRVVHVWEYSSTGTPVFDTSAGATGTTSTTDEVMSSGNFTTASTTELCVAFYGAYTANGVTSQSINGQLAANNLGPDGQNCLSWDKTFSSTFTGAATGVIHNSGTQWIIVAAAFK